MFELHKENSKIKKGRHDNMYNTESMLPFSEIRSDTIILKDGGLRAIIKVEGLNIDLKNTDEQEAIVEQYKRFLNGLDFPLQILVRNTYLELSDYIEYMEKNIAHIENEALHEQGVGYVDFLNNINLQQGLIYIKEFYIIVPFYPTKTDVDGIRKPWRKKFLDALSQMETPEKIVERYRGFVKHEKFLDSRVQVVLNTLQGIGLQGKRLGLRDIITLLFKCYNPDLHKNQAEY